jgi:uncharacterized protein
MSDSIRDQLLKLGLANKQQAKQAQAHKPKPSRHQPKPAADPAATAAQRAQAAKLLRDHELNRKEQAKLEARAKAARLRQLIDQHRLPPIEGDGHYSFQDGTRIARIAVDAARRAQLIAGQLVIISYAGRIDVVPAAAAERIAEQNPAVVIRVDAPARSPADSAAADDPYKGYEVPDDLMW